MNVLSAAIIFVAAAQFAAYAQAPDPQGMSAAVDVRYTGRESRPLTDAESLELRKGLHYQPTQAPISPGGWVRVTLEDSSGSQLVVVTVKWERTVRMSNTVWDGVFQITMSNKSDCEFTSSANFIDPAFPTYDSSGISFATWVEWVNLQEPHRGETSSFGGVATLYKNYQSLIFKPTLPGYSLSQCRTSGSFADSTVRVTFNNSLITQTISVGDGIVTIRQLWAGPSHGQTYKFPQADLNGAKTSMRQQGGAWVLSLVLPQRSAHLHIFGGAGCTDEDDEMVSRLELFFPNAAAVRAAAQNLVGQSP